MFDFQILVIRLLASILYAVHYPALLEDAGIEEKDRVLSLLEDGKYFIHYRRKNLNQMLDSGSPRYSD